MLPLPLWAETELAYLAGIMDGEGCFVLRLHRTGRIGSSIHVGNTDVRMLQWIQKRFGGSIYRERRNNALHKPVWRWQAEAHTMEAIIRGMLPFLVIKRDRAELLLAYRETVGPVIRQRPSTNDVPAAVQERRLQIRSQLLALNRRGVKT